MEDIWTCPNCGDAMKKVTNTLGLYRICQKCGCTIEGRKQNFESQIICPNCHQDMGDGEECFHCGYDLGSDFD
jgi:predicted amidophosphoribosyltransferase